MSILENIRRIFRFLKVQFCDTFKHHICVLVLANDEQTWRTGGARLTPPAGVVIWLSENATPFRSGSVG